LACIFIFEQIVVRIIHFTSMLFAVFTFLRSKDALY
jgi:hypothetical protein